MTKVYVTQTGQRYHSRTDLACLEKAHSIADVDLDTAIAGGLAPCLVCDAPAAPGVSEGDTRWLRTIDDWARSGTFESFWEQAFARRVLAQLPQLSSDAVEPQAYVTVNGENFKVDFLIPTDHILIEIDGYAKDGAAPTPTDLERRNRRDAALQSAGYKVLHFSNAQVQQEPASCRTQIAAALSVSPPRFSTASSSPVVASTPQTPVRSADQPPTPPAAPSSAPSRVPVAIWIAVGLGLVAMFAVIVVLISATGSGGSEDTATSGSTTPVNGECPSGYPYKGNINDAGEFIVHAPGQRFYDPTDPEMCFDSLDSAIEAGFRAPRN